jgi:hypothetical protein
VLRHPLGNGTQMFTATGTIDDHWLLSLMRDIFQMPSCRPKNSSASLNWSNSVTPEARKSHQVKE